MSEETLTKCKRMAYRLSYNELNALSRYVKKRKEKLWRIAREDEDLEHAKRIFALPVGTEVLVKFGERANQIGTIKKHGRKYTYVWFDDGWTWRLLPRSVDDRIDNESVKNTALMNQRMFPTLNKIFAEEIE